MEALSQGLDRLMAHDLAALRAARRLARLRLVENLSTRSPCSLRGWTQLPCCTWNLACRKPRPDWRVRLQRRNDRSRTVIAANTHNCYWGIRRVSRGWYHTAPQKGPKWSKTGSIQIVADAYFENGVSYTLSQRPFFQMGIDHLTSILLSPPPTTPPGGGVRPRHGRQYTRGVVESNLS